MPGQRAALAAAGLPSPPPGPWSGPSQQPQHPGGPRNPAAAPAGSAPADGWLEAILGFMSGGAALAAAFDEAAPGPARRAARFAGAWAEDAARVQQGLAQLQEGWGPGLEERCVEEGWRGHYTLPPA